MQWSFKAPMKEIALLVVGLREFLQSTRKRRGEFYGTGQGRIPLPLMQTLSLIYPRRVREITSC